MSAKARKSRSSPREIVLLEETFQGLTPGPVSQRRSAFGEYHTPPVVSEDDAWADAVLRTGQTGPCWQVAHDGDRPVFEAGQLMPTRPAILVLDGAGALQEGTFTADVRPLSSQGACGLVFGYHGNRTFFALLWEPSGRLALVRNEHDARTVIASADLAWGVDDYRRIGVKIAAGRARALVDGKAVCEGAMEPFVTGVLDGPRREGKVGLIAHAPGRFAAPRLSCPPRAARARRQRLSAYEKQLAGLRRANPGPVAVSECSLGDFGAGRSLRIADLDGDGELEFIIGQHSLRADGGNYSQISCLTAFRPNGEVLWQLGAPVKPTSLDDAPTFDLPFQVADIDNDTRCELVMCRDWQIQVRDARTGSLLRSAPTPRSTRDLKIVWFAEDHYDRICGDSIHLCDLSGRGRLGEILIKDRYSNLWAYDADTLEPIWHVVLNTGHYPLAFDINGDGRDEVLCGYSLISADGELLWQKRFHDHVDGIGVGRFHPDRDDLQVALVAGEAGFILLSAGGEVLARHHTGHLQKMSIGSFLPDAGGVQIATITYWASQGVFSVFDGAGVKLHESEPWHAASALTPVRWRGDGTDLLLLSAHPDTGGMLDGVGRRVVTFPYGHPHLACDAVDLDGDGRDEVLAWDFERFTVFKASGHAPHSVPPRYTGPLWNRSNYKANVSLPPEMVRP
ncbi:MAG TPA: hypothetical protein VFJ30_18540 [Phycisphaerae bacterium]|nr:hypothetical protein [Phycisphaerae bacterium]